MPPHIHLTINRAVALKDALSMHDEISVRKGRGSEISNIQLFIKEWRLILCCDQEMYIRSKDLYIDMLSTPVYV